ncbi:hypothetical protein Hypma_005404 [Hypsizygus marmoreus]|uniref:Uncharacterized protein n=1 Tax=Hypsizygus marmoreus TaxID=39966 RepID=A0A369K4M4_HYPMA|nr:hypothetical protein Hypma_005404 [Hypsizygus marmoreus]
MCIGNVVGVSSSDPSSRRPTDVRRGSVLQFGSSLGVKEHVTMAAYGALGLNWRIAVTTFISLHLSVFFSSGFDARVTAWDGAVSAVGEWEANAEPREEFVGWFDVVLEAGNEDDGRLAFRKFALGLTGRTFNGR